LIAGLRSWIKGSGASSLDPYAERAAGPQGQAMAKKFSIETPQLADLVKARTLNCDDALRNFGARYDRFIVVNIGCGYDARPWRLKDLGHVTWVFLDLPTMMRDREQVLPPFNESPYRILNADYDILSDSLQGALESAGAPTDQPIFFIWEGGSMYFSQAESRDLLAQISGSMDPRSRLWFDYASYAAVNDLTGLNQIEEFMSSMRMIGEPFTRGFESVEHEVGDAGLAVVTRTSAAKTLNCDDPVMAHYNFALCARTAERV
jgi:methyltransferase (TIGR00027 family)